MLNKVQYQQVKEVKANTKARLQAIEVSFIRIPFKLNFLWNIKVYDASDNQDTIKILATLTTRPGQRKLSYKSGSLHNLLCVSFCVMKFCIYFPL